MCYTRKDHTTEAEEARGVAREEGSRRRREAEAAVGHGDREEEKPLFEKVKEMVGAGR